MSSRHLWLKPPTPAWCIGCCARAPCPSSAWRTSRTVRARGFEQHPCRVEKLDGKRQLRRRSERPCNGGLHVVREEGVAGEPFRSGQERPLRPSLRQQARHVLVVA